MELGMRGQLALLLAALEDRRGTAVDMQHWFRMFSLDVAGASAKKKKRRMSSICMPNPLLPLFPRLSFTFLRIYFHVADACSLTHRKVARSSYSFSFCLVVVRVASTRPNSADAQDLVAGANAVFIQRNDY
jgi:hypothetical protein